MFSKIVVPLDGSSLAEGILDRVEDLARLQGGEIQLLRVAFFYPFPAADTKKFESEVIEAAEKYLEKVSADLEQKGLKVTVHVRYGDPAGEILAHAEKYGSVIVMSTYGRGGISRWAMGSVADRVIRRSKKPVLMIRSAERQQD